MSYEGPITINLVEVGWIMMAVHDRADRGDKTALGIIKKLTALAESIETSKGSLEGSMVLNLLENGYLIAAAVWDHAKDNRSVVARPLYLKLKSHAIACGVEWYYGDPWPQEEAESS